MDPRPGQPFVYVDEMNSVLAHFGVDITKADERGHWPLYTAAWQGKTSLVAGLLAAGSDANQRDHRGITPLHLAGGAGHAEIIRLLLSCGADINSVDAQEQTPIRLTACCDGGQKEEVIPLLLKAGADIHRADDKGVTPLHAAARSDMVTSTRLLLEAGADPNRADHAGKTALHHAVICRSNPRFDTNKTLQCLIKAGGDVNRVDEQGRSPLDDALYYGHRPCLWLLLREGATFDIGKLVLEVKPIAFTDAGKYFCGPPGKHQEQCRALAAERILHALRYVDKLAVAGGYENLVRKYRQVLTAPRHGCVTRYLRQRFGRDAPHDVAVLVLAFWKPPGGP